MTNKEYIFCNCMFLLRLRSPHTKAIFELVRCVRALPRAIKLQPCPEITRYYAHP